MVKASIVPIDLSARCNALLSGLKQCIGEIFHLHFYLVKRYSHDTNANELKQLLFRFTLLNKHFFLCVITPQNQCEWQRENCMLQCHICEQIIVQIPTYQSVKSWFLGFYSYLFQLMQTVKTIIWRFSDVLVIITTVRVYIYR